MAAGQLAELYLEACEIELQAFKPGNVSVYAGGHDMTVEDFRVSAKVSAKALCNPALSLGEKIYHGVKATREAVGCNTNLGVILLCAPLLQAAFRCGRSLPLRESLRQVLNETTIADAAFAFKAITLAAPGGLGAADEQDVARSASVTLLEAMQMARDRDRIALQYCTAYKDIFDFAILRYNSRLNQWGLKKWAALAVYTGLLSRYSDSHIVRKYGDRYSSWVAEKMALLEEALEKSTNPEQLEPMLRGIDQAFKSQGINPGTSADLTVATVLAASLEDFYTD
ncbi:MAG: triphosphoribosyl-dephospho-CoA synthase [Gammaproteobacteria bacterium HGW-Gammaproteobacteria-3]|nr:MAG: triphosphoribosyl-dephospho-CoA synthase [Gammaproteobacteria bacterium HGW-Gammaproteobacteria-3]